MRNTPAPNTRYVALSRNYVYHLPCPASLSVCLLLFARAPTPPNSNCRRTQLFHPPISKRFYHFLHFYADFPHQKQFSYFCCFLTCELYWTDKLPGFHYRTDFLFASWCETVLTTKKPNRLKHATVPYFAAVIRRVQPISCGCFNNLWMLWAVGYHNLQACFWVENQTLGFASDKRRKEKKRVGFYYLWSVFSAYIQCQLLLITGIDLHGIFKCLQPVKISDRKSTQYTCHQTQGSEAFNHRCSLRAFCFSVAGRGSSTLQKSFCAFKAKL